MMLIVTIAEDYCALNRLARTPIHGANRFVRYSGVSHVDEIDTAACQRYRAAATAAGLSPWTIEKAVTDVVTLVRAATGRVLDPGKRLRRTRPHPRPATIEHIDAAFGESPPWLQQWIVLAYWTGLRLGDSIRMQTSLGSIEPGQDLRFTARKTGHRHSWPRPAWIDHWLTQVPPCYPKSAVNAAKQVRDALCTATIRARVPTILPKHMRQRSITEWSRANGMAGAIIHGSGLKVLTHYVDPSVVLEASAPRVRLPPRFGHGTEDKTQQLVTWYKRIDAAGQQLILDTTQRLCGG